MIKLRNVSKIYPGKVFALKDVSLHILPKEFVSIVGRSGTGKTTLAKMLIAEESPDRGKVIIGGWDITRIQPSDIPGLRRQIGVVFQDFKLLPNKTVWENIAFALQVCGSGPVRIKKIVPQILKIVELENKANRYPYQLSGGEKQRVAIARALAHQPKILIADEPTGNLDAFHSREIVDLLLKINEFGTTVVFISHNREMVNYIRKRVITLEAGEIISDQTVGKYIL